MKEQCLYIIVKFACAVDTTSLSSDGDKRIVKIYCNIPFEREENVFFKSRVIPGPTRWIRS